MFDKLKKWLVGQEDRYTSLLPEVPAERKVDVVKKAASKKAPAKKKPAAPKPAPAKKPVKKTTKKK